MKKFMAVNISLIIILSAIINIWTAFKVGGADSSTKSEEEYSDEQWKAIETITVSSNLPSVPEMPETTQEIKNRWGIELSEVEHDMVARITMLEAGGESDKGQQAVVEVILNRIYSDKFPDTVYEVLSQENNGCKQFVSWNNRNKDKATPTEKVLRNVNAVLNGETNILPYNTLYFSLDPLNDHVQCVIGNHVFCNQP